MVNMCLRSTLIICIPSWVQSMNTEGPLSTEKTLAGKYNYDAKKMIFFSGDAIDEKIQAFLLRKIQTWSEDQVEMGKV